MLSYFNFTRFDKIRVQTGKVISITLYLSVQ